MDSQKDGTAPACIGMLVLTFLEIANTNFPLLSLAEPFLFIYLISSARYIISAICLYIPQLWSNNKTKRYLVPSSGQEWDKLGIKQVKDIFPFVRGKDERESVRMFERERERERERSVLRMIVE